MVHSAPHGSSIALESDGLLFAGIAKASVLQDCITARQIIVPYSSIPN